MDFPNFTSQGCSWCYFAVAQIVAVLFDLFKRAALLTAFKTLIF
jgi:hypothetical protein